MSDSLLVAIVSGLIYLFTTALVGYLASRVMLKMSRQIQDLHIQLNSRLTELLRLTSESSHAEGVKEERERNQNDL